MPRRIPRLRRESTMTLEETGLARLCFFAGRFHGVLVNKCEEVFSVRGNQHVKPSQIADSNGDRSEFLYDVKIVDLSNEYEYQVKNVRMIVGDDGEHQLLSPSLTFKTEDLLVGNRADREIRQHLSHDLIGTDQSVHVGPMWIDVTVTVALPEQKDSIPEEVRPADFLQ